MIRIPYLHTLRSYKGDFLWNTTNVAIWTTVEVGVGITAGCFATLRPLMKRVLALLGESPRTISPSLHNPGHSSKKVPSAQNQVWTNFRPAHDMSIITTTFSGRGYPRSAGHESHEELFVGSSPVGLTILELQGISKSVEFAITREERISLDEDKDDKDIKSPSPVVYETS